MMWNNTVSSPGSPGTSNRILKKAERLYLCREWPAIKSIQAFLAGYISSYERYNIDIYIQRTTKLLTPIIKSIATLKLLIQNKRTWWFMAQTFCSAFVQNIVRIGYLPSILLLWFLLTPRKPTKAVIKGCLYSVKHNRWVTIQIPPSTPIKHALIIHVVVWLCRTKCNAHKI